MLSVQWWTVALAVGVPAGIVGGVIVVMVIRDYRDMDEPVSPENPVEGHETRFHPLKRERARTAYCAACKRVQQVTVIRGGPGTRDRARCDVCGRSWPGVR